VPIPRLALELMVEILKQIASGNAVSIVQLRKEVTTYEATEILNVSRPFVISLLEKGEMSFRKSARIAGFRSRSCWNPNAKQTRFETKHSIFWPLRLRNSSSIRVAWRRSRRCWTPVYSIPPGFAIFF
jgi:hypothetical protein